MENKYYDVKLLLSFQRILPRTQTRVGIIISCYWSNIHQTSAWGLIRTTLRHESLVAEQKVSDQPLHNNPLLDGLWLIRQFRSAVCLRYQVVCVYTSFRLPCNSFLKSSGICNETIRLKTLKRSCESRNYVSIILPRFHPHFPQCFFDWLIVICLVPPPTFLGCAR